MGETTAAITFEDNSQNLDKIIKSSKLPTIIKYDHAQVLEKDLVDPEFDSTQFHLLSSTTHIINRIHARTAVYQPKLKCVLDGGHDVIIDDNYDGWFAVFGNPNNAVNEMIVPHYRNIGKLCISSCQKFLVSGKESLEAMKVFRHANEQKSLTPHQIEPGTVLTKGNVYTVSLKIKVKKHVFKSKVVKKEETYMACWDEQRNEELLVACHTDGIFYVLSQKIGEMKVPLMTISEILESERYSFPLLVKLVHGDTIKLPQSCTPLLTLIKSQQSKTAMVSTLYAQPPTLYAMNIDTPIRFFKGKPNQDIRIDSIFSRVILNCLEKSYLLHKRMVFRQNEQSSSARSSATSGHDSGNSGEDDKVDWSLSSTSDNTPFIQCLNSSNDYPLSYTHLSEIPTPQKTQTPKQQNKDRKTTIETTGIKRNKMYELHLPGPNDSIPISTKRRASQESSRSAQETHSILTSTSPTGRRYTSEIDLSQTEYSPIWRDDTSSVTSGESLEVEVENVTVSGEQDQSAIHEYTNISAQLAATVRLKNQKRKSLTAILSNKENEEEPEYELLTDVKKTRDPSVHSFMALGRAPPPPPPSTTMPNSSQSTSKPKSSFSDSSKSGMYYNESAIQKNHLYEQPTGIKEPINRTGTYIEPTPPYYNDGFKGSVKYDALYKDDDNQYETLYSSVYESIADFGPQKLQQSGEYINISETSGSYQNIGREEQTAMDSKIKNHIKESPPKSSSKEINNNVTSPIYVNTEAVNGSQDYKDCVLGKLIANMKTLGLKPATEKMLKTIDLNNFQMDGESSDFKTKLGDMFPEINKIDLNKISLYLQTNQMG